MCLLWGPIKPGFAVGGINAMPQAICTVRDQTQHKGRKWCANNRDRRQCRIVLLERVGTIDEGKIDGDGDGAVPRRVGPETIRYIGNPCSLGGGDQIGDGGGGS